ncbi:hypothetical protein ACJ8PQ_21500, partial [Serratia sp. CY74664]|uniref:hypothetical protein n=1 Tax=Serratia sp. CY74664 TaxID=3383676 RepID=UPI003FA0F005
VENENHYHHLAVARNIRIISIPIRHLAAKKDGEKSPRNGMAIARSGHWFLRNERNFCFQEGKLLGDSMGL